MRGPAAGGRRVGPARACVLVAAILVIVGCGGSDADGGTIDHETFVTTWVDLRNAAMRHGEAELPAAERARVLAEHGVTEDDLLRFAEVHGSDVAYMKAVWDEVEVRLQERNPGGGTAPDAGPGSTG